MGTTPVDDATRRTNWAGNVTYGFEEILLPRTVADVQALVAGHRRVRAIGSGHSFTDLPDSAVGLCLAPHLTDVAVEPDARSAWVGGGATYAAVATALRPHGLALHNLASLPHISVAGAVATATHGSGAGLRNLAAAVSAVRLVTATGDLVELARGDDGFDGAVVSLGLLGVVTELRLDVEPAVEHSQRVLDGLTWHDLETRTHDVLRLGHSVSIFTAWDDGALEVWVKSRADRADDPAATFPHLVQATTERHPVPRMDPVNTTAQQGVAGWWAERLPHFRMGFTPSNGEEIQSEYHVPAQQAGRAVSALRAVGPRVTSVLQVAEIRAVAADSQWLSPQHETDTVSFHFTWTADQARVEAALAHVEDALLPLGARPHWGKLFLACPGASYPRLSDFLGLRERMDPRGTFLNDWTRRTLGL